MTSKTHKARHAPPGLKISLPLMDTPAELCTISKWPLPVHNQLNPEGGNSLDHEAGGAVHVPSHCLGHLKCMEASLVATGTEGGVGMGVWGAEIKPQGFWEKMSQLKIGFSPWQRTSAHCRPRHKCSRACDAGQSYPGIYSRNVAETSPTISLATYFCRWRVVDVHHCIRFKVHSTLVWFIYSVKWSPQ